MAEEINKPKAKEDHVERAYRGIRQMLFHNEIMPGQKISYRDLAERLKMSPTPVIQALKWLEFQGLVRKEHNRGYYTEPIRLQEIEEIYDMRELIEISLLPKTVRLLDKEGTERLDAALRSHADALQESYLNRRLITDKEFHLVLASLSGCRTQAQILNSLFDLLYLKYKGDILFFTVMRAVGTEHQAIFDALCKRDLPAARKAMTGHIRNVRDHVIRSLEGSLKEMRETEF